MSERSVSVELNIDVQPFVRAMERAGRAAHEVSLAFMWDKRAKRRHIRRCRICSPMSNPRPLGIDGSAYRLRRKRR